MKIVRVKAISKKEILQIIRDPLSLMMAFLLPALLLFIFSYAITLDIRDFKTVVLDQDKSSLSRDLLSKFKESRYFKIISYLENPDELDKYLDKNKAMIGIWIPQNFYENIKSGKKVEVQIIVDASDSNTANIALGYISGITGIFSQELKGNKKKPIIDIDVRFWYNPELKSRNFIIPGLIAVIMVVIAALLTSLTISREWERGTMEQLISTPIKSQELILGKIIPYFFIGFIDVAFSVFMAVFVFKVPLKGSLSLLAILSSIFLFGGLSLGILISSVTKSQLLSSQVSMVVTFLPAFLLSGFMFSISNMPKALQFITYFIPARYFVSILKNIFLKGSTFNFLITETTLLFIFGISIFLIANKKFVKRIE